MLRIRTLVVFFLFAIAVTPVLVATNVQAQTVDEIVKKHIDAIGGQTAWDNIKTVRVTGTVNAQGTEINITISHALNRGFRMDLDIMGMANYQVANMKEGWSYFPVQGQQQPEPFTADQLKESQEQMGDLNDPLIHYKDNGTKVQYAGKEDVDGTECFKLVLTRKSGKIETLFIDPSTYYCIRSTEKSKADGQEHEANTDFSNFKKLPEGIVVPMNIQSPQGPFAAKKYEINPTLDDKLFQKS